MRLKENDYKQKAKKYLISNGFSVFSLSSQFTVGLPDQIALKNGITVYLEYKVPGNKLSPMQEIVKQDIEKQGCSYFLVYTDTPISTLLEKLNNHIYTEVCKTLDLCRKTFNKLLQVPQVKRDPEMEMEIESRKDDITQLKAIFWKFHNDKHPYSSRQNEILSLQKRIEFLKRGVGRPPKEHTQETSS